MLGVSSDALDILRGLVDDFSPNLVVEECRSMQWWAHDGVFGLGWMAGLVMIVSCTAR